MVMFRTVHYNCGAVVGSESFTVWPLLFAAGCVRIIPTQFPDDRDSCPGIALYGGVGGLGKESISQEKGLGRGGCGWVGGWAGAGGWGDGQAGSEGTLPGGVQSQLCKKLRKKPLGTPS